MNVGDRVQADGHWEGNYYNGQRGRVVETYTGARSYCRILFDTKVHDGNRWWIPVALLTPETPASPLQLEVQEYCNKELGR